MTRCSRKWLGMLVALCALLGPAAAGAADGVGRPGEPADLAGAGIGSQGLESKAVTVTGTAPTITSAATTTFTLGVPGSFTFTATGSPLPNMALGGAKLPSGVKFTNLHNGVGTLAGTPPANSAKTYLFTVKATNGVKPDAAQPFTFIITGAPKFTSAANTACAVGMFCTFKVAAAGFPLPSIARSGAALPAGMTYVNNGKGTGTLSGTPAGGSQGQYAIVFTASNTGGPSAVQNFTLTVNAYLGFTSVATKTCVVGVFCTFKVTATGKPLPTTSRSGGTVPAGMTFVGKTDGTGTLSGTPAVGTGGLHTLNVTAHNGVEPDAVQNFALIINEPPTITSSAATTCAIAVACTVDVTTTGYPRPTLAISGVALPPNLAFVDDGDGTGTLSGMPAVGTGGSYALVFTATNGVSTPAVQNFGLAINESLAITSAGNTDCVVGSPCTFTFTTDGAPTPAIHLGGEALPAAVIFTDNHDGSGALSGTPAAGTAGTYSLSVTATNGVEADAVQGFTLTVNEAPLITSAAGTTCIVDAPCTFAVTTTGFPAPAIARTGDALPVNLTWFDDGDGTGTLSGTAIASSGGVYHFNFTASNGIGTDAVQHFTLTVSNLNRPTAPLGVSALAGDAQAEVSFLPPASDGGVPVSGYTATCTTDVGAPIAVSLPGSPITVPGLFNGSTYTCTVHATNANGDGPESAPSNPVTPTVGAVPVSLTVALEGSGTGAVTSQPAGSGCPGDCAQPYPTGTGVVLTATETGGSVFTGWQGGGCTGATSTCTITVTAPTTLVIATFAAPGTSVTLDVDLSAPGTRYDPLTDGMMVLRYLFDLPGSLVVAGATGPTATRKLPAAVEAYLDDIRPARDADGNGRVDALTDGLLILRNLLGLTDTMLTDGAVGPGAKRVDATAIELYLQTIKP